MADFALGSLRGGLNDTDPPSALAEDSCTLAENIEFVKSTLGERRLGCTAADLPVSITGDSSLDAVSWMFRHVPSNDEGQAELWALAQSLDSTQNLLARRTTSAWSTVSPLDAIVSSTDKGHRLSAQTLHGKLFIAYDSAVDRLHVWDGTNLRRTGLAQPSAAPTGANQGSGSLTGTRYYRVRYTVKSGATTLRRSEPSAVLTFSPSGSGSAVRVTKPASISESETHWELEASTDNANFYVIATTVVGTTTVDDSTAYVPGYAAFELSEDIEDYSLIPSGKFLSADEDRLIIAGSWEDSSQASRVRWTPVFGAPGNGNDERLEGDTDPYLDLDGFEGGEITGLSRAVNGYLYAFKRSHVYKLVRTGTRAKAYEAFPLTKAKGALPGSLVEAVDQAGQPAQYFLDPRSGPHRIGPEGLQWCGRDIQTFWQTVNIDAAIPCHGVFYPAKQQVHYWVATGESEYPNEKIVVHVNEMRNTDEGARRGWVTVPSPNRIASAHCSLMFAPNVDSTDPRELSLVPLIGQANADRDLVQRCDTGSDDNGSDYFGKVRTKPFMFGGLLNQHEVKAGALLAKASDGVVHVKAVRDYGIETKTVETAMNAFDTEEHVIKQLDNLSFAELYALQIELGDLDADEDPSSAYELNGLALKLSKGQTA